QFPDDRGVPAGALQGLGEHDLGHVPPDAGDTDIMKTIFRITVPSLASRDNRKAIRPGVTAAEDHSAGVTPRAVSGRPRTEASRGTRRREAWGPARWGATPPAPPRSAARAAAICRLHRGWADPPSRAPVARSAAALRPPSSAAACGCTRL